MKRNVFCIEKMLMCLLWSCHLLINTWLLSYESFVVNNVCQVLLYVNSNEKWTGMKNTGLKMPEKDQFYV